MLKTSETCEENESTCVRKVRIREETAGIRHVATGLNDVQLRIPQERHEKTVNSARNVKT